MKKFLCIALLALTGCTTVYMPNGQKYLTTAARHIVINNSGFLLDVTVDGLPLTTLGNGQTVAVIANWLVPQTQVSVIAHDAHGNYVGASSYTFHAATADTWQINRVERPQISF